MTLTLHYHPLAAFCWKPLIALYENAVPFEGAVVNLQDDGSRETFRKVWPMMRFPVLVDEARGVTVAESSIVIEYLDAFHPGPKRMVPEAGDDAWKVRMWDRFFDGYVAEQLQKVVGDNLRPEESRDPYGVGQAREMLRRAYATLDERYLGEDFVRSGVPTLALCAAVPALFYANAVEPIAETAPAVARHLAELMARPAVARVLAEAEPFFQYVPIPASLSPDPASIVVS